MGIRKMVLPLALLAAPLLSSALPRGLPGARAAGPALLPFSSTANPYRIGYPTGWRHLVGHLGGAFSLFSFDQFVDPARPRGFPVNVVVARLPLAAPTTDAGLRALYEASLRRRTPVAELGPARVAGRTVTLVGYADVAQHVQAYLAEGRLSWVFSLTTARGDRARWQPLFVRMLGSFRPR